MKSDEKGSSKEGIGLGRNVWAVTITSFLTDVSSEMISNLLPLFLFNVIGVRTAVIGFIEGIAETTASILKIFSGWLSDRLGTRKGLAVFGYSLSTLAKPLLYFATSWGWVLGVRLADRTGKGLRTAPRDALLADSVHEKKRGLAFGLHRAGDTAGAVIGLLIALGVILATQRDEVLLTRKSFQIIVLLSIIPAVLAVFVLAIVAQEVRVSRQMRTPSNLVFAGLGIRFRFFLIVVILFTLGNSSDAFLILRAQNAGLSLVAVMGMMITFNLVYTFVSGPAGALSDRVGRRRVLLVGWLLYSLVYLGFALARSGWHAWGLMAIYGIYYGLSEGVAKAYVADLIPSELRGTAYGVYSAAVGLTAFPASLIAGFLWQGAGAWAGWGPSAPFIFGSVLALLATVMLLFLPRFTSSDRKQ